MNICSKQPPLRFLMNHMLGSLISDPPDGSLTHFTATVTEFLCAFILSLDCLLELGIVVLVGKLIAEPFHQGLFQDLIWTSVASQFFPSVEKLECQTL
jgi:hypothetical protein